MKPIFVEFCGARQQGGVGREGRRYRGPRKYQHFARNSHSSLGGTIPVEAGVGGAVEEGEVAMAC